MERAALHVELRSSLEVSDELRRHEHAAGDDDLADDFAYLEDMLDELERHIGKSHADPVLCLERAAGQLQLAIQAIELRRSHVPRRLRGRLRVLLESTRRVAIVLREPNAPVLSKPLFGVLPLVRLVSQDIHAAIDYLGYAAALLSALVARTLPAKFVGAQLALGGTAVSTLTDRRIGTLPVISIETHEGLDLAWGVTMLASPFVLGYARKDRAASAIQVVAGACAIALAIFTNYRTELGTATPYRSKGGGSRSAGGSSAGKSAGNYSGRKRRLSEMPRPLEGLSSAPTDWNPSTERT
ncbi:MAG: hypothetical protein FWD73_10860 [Polyangiaceae bacterium]|nr:hypothetical protein [Polyangiaceae bacterium]